MRPRVLARMALLLACCLTASACVTTQRSWEPGRPAAAAPGWMSRPARPLPAGIQEEASEQADDEVIIPLWPLVEWTVEDDGSQDLWIFIVYAHHTRPDGSLESLRVLTYMSGPDYRALLPFFYDVGPEGDADKGVIPLAFWSPTYAVFPLALSMWWKSADGSTTTWITPLYHASRDAQGDLEGRHVLTYVQWGESWVAFPLAYGMGPEDARHHGIVPFWFGGPGYGIVPLALSWSWDHDDGSNSLWITPLIHRSSRDGETTSYHVLNWIAGDGYWVFFPFLWSFDGPAGGSFGFMPFLWWSRDFWLSPLGLSAGWSDGPGRDTLWITPLFHHSSDPSGSDNWHLLTWFQGSGYQLFFPLYYDIGEPEARYRGVVPLWFETPELWIAPLLLSGGWNDEEGQTHTWLTPFYHRTTRPDGSDSWHLLTWFQGPEYTVFFPLFFNYGPEGAERRGFFSLDYDEPGGWAIPPLLTARWKDSDDETTTWITPFYHRTEREDGEPSWHLLTWVQGPDYKVFFPFFYSYGQEGDKTRGLVPLYFDGSGWWIAPLLLSGGWSHGDGQGSTNWYTPLAHVSTDGDGVDSYHLLTWYQDRNGWMLFPLAWDFGSTGQGFTGVMPFWMGGAHWWFSPLLLSGGWSALRERSLWITPLYHHTQRDDAPDSWHLINYFQGPDYKLFFPLAWSLGPEDKRYRGVFPLWFDAPDWSVAPLLLSGWWRSEDSSESLWITPLFHQTYGPPQDAVPADTSETDHWPLRSRHLLNWIEGPDYATFFPFYWRYRTEFGDRRDMLLPLYWQTDYADGDFAASVLPPFFAYREAAELNTSLLYQSIPFSYQDCGDDWELNILWRLWHERRQGDETTTIVGPLWYSEQDGDLPLDYKILGGLFARDVFESRNTYRYRFFWFFSTDEQPVPMP